MSSSPTKLECLTKEQIQNALSKLTMEWNLSEDGKEIIRAFQFKGFYKTMAFVNSIAWIAQKEQHHPDMQVSFNQCIVHYTTHDADGLTANDFNCARQIESLLG